MTFLLDTNICIAFINGQNDNLRRRFTEQRPSDIALCAIVKAELLFGAHNSARTERNLERVETFCRPFVSLPFDDQAAGAYGIIRADLQRRGLPIGPNDLMIAAIAAANNLTLVTHNTREFGRVENLRCDDWMNP